MKAKRYDEHRVYFICPGCRISHNCRHQFNGDFERPTFTPSVVQEFGDGTQCHSFVQDGRINFLDDSTHHELRGWYDLPEISEAGS